jgi:hypothetical protein
VVDKSKEPCGGKTVDVEYPGGSTSVEKKAAEGADCATQQPASQERSTSG